MSYILDALRKSDQQRRQGAAPTLASTPMLGAETRRPKFLWMGLLAAAMLISGILIGGWRPWQAGHEPAPVAIVAGPPSDRATEAEKRSLPLTPRVEVAPNLPAPGQLVVTPGQASVAPSPAEKPRQLAAAAVEPAQPIAPVAPVAPKPASAEPGPAVAESKVLARADLPPAIQQDIPKLVVALHAYSSKPGSRLVSVNDQLLHEGEELTPGLILEQITPDGMVFSYKGYRFRNGVR